MTVVGSCGWSRYFGDLHISTFMSWSFDRKDKPKSPTKPWPVVKAVTRGVQGFGSPGESPAEPGVIWPALVLDGRLCYGALVTTGKSNLSNFCSTQSDCETGFYCGHRFGAKDCH